MRLTLHKENEISTHLHSSMANYSQASHRSSPLRLVWMRLGDTGSPPFQSYVGREGRKEGGCAGKAFRKGQSDNKSGHRGSRCRRRPHLLDRRSRRWNYRRTGAKHGMSTSGLLWILITVPLGKLPRALLVYYGMTTWKHARSQLRRTSRPATAWCGKA